MKKATNSNIIIARIAGKASFLFIFEKNYLMNFIVRDNKNKIYQTFWGESKEKEFLVANNVFKIYEVTKQHVNINSVASTFNPEEHLGPGWINDQGLYDKLINDFNNLGGETLIA